MPGTKKVDLPDLDKATVEELSEIRDEVVRELVERARAGRPGDGKISGHDSVYHDKST